MGLLLLGAGPGAMYQRAARAQYLREAVQATMAVPRATLEQAQTFLSTMERNKCKSPVQRLRAECMQTVSRQFCRERPDGGRCLLYTDVIATNILSQDRLVFAWRAGDLAGVDGVFPYLLAGGGVAAVAAGKLALPVAVRGWAAALVGLVPIVYAHAALAARSTAGAWQAKALAPAILLCAVGLLVRSEYRSSRVGRALASAGAVALLLLLLSPAPKDSILVGALEALARGSDGAAKLAGGLLLLPVVLIAAGALTWLPPSISFGSAAFAWCAIVWEAVALLVPVGHGALTLETGRLELAKATLAQFVHLPVAALACHALAAFGRAALAGKRLEHV
jgi:hypothetical protein